MNKIKVLYDVFRTMKGKEEIKGSLKVNGEKDGVRFIKLENEFEKNMTTGYTKAKISSEFNNDGKSFKHESSSEFDMGKFPGHRHGQFMRHMHNHGHNCDEMRAGGHFQGLSKITFLFGVLNNLELKETENEGALLTLNTKDFPEEMKKTFKEGMMEHKKFHRDYEQNGFDEQTMGKGHRGHHEFMKELQGIIDPNIELNIWINKNSEIDKILINANGKGTEEKGPKEISIRAELELVG